MVLIAAGTVLHLLIPKPMRTGHVAKLLGWTSTIAGLGLAVEATRAAGSVDLERPERLITDGVYAGSRHPMYVGWTLIYGGIALITGNGWLVVLSPVLAGVVHLETAKEERALRSAFGSDYDTYMTRVRRYL